MPLPLSSMLNENCNGWVFWKYGTAGPQPQVAQLPAIAANGRLYISILLGLVITVTLTGSAAQSSEPGRTVTVCIHPGNDQRTVHSAELLASAIFAKAGVQIDWHHYNPCPQGLSTIKGDMLYRTPEDMHPKAFAIAKPHEREIVVFYDRIQELHVDHLTCLLAYVLAHEIAHVMQGTRQHSNSGVMKVGWSSSDYFDMIGGRLSFTPEDIVLIYRGLDTQEPLRKSIPDAYRAGTTHSKQPPPPKP